MRAEKPALAGGIDFEPKVSIRAIGNNDIHWHLFPPALEIVRHFYLPGAGRGRVQLQFQFVRGRRVERQESFGQGETGPRRKRAAGE